MKGKVVDRNSFMSIMTEAGMELDKIFGVTEERGSDKLDGGKYDLYRQSEALLNCIDDSYHNGVMRTLGCGLIKQWGMIAKTTQSILENAGFKIKFIEEVRGEYLYRIDVPRISTGGK